jgi:hypothetical protein
MRECRLTVMIMGALESILPNGITARAIILGSEPLSGLQTELVLPYVEALAAVMIATEHKIAILGLEAHEVKKEGLFTVGLADASAYIRYAGDWQTYVDKMNAEAEAWLKLHRLGENHGYILTSASETEFTSLTNKKK